MSGRGLGILLLVLGAIVVVTTAVHKLPSDQ